MSVASDLDALGRKVQPVQCKVCRFLLPLDPETRMQWEDELANPSRSAELLRRGMNAKGANIMSRSGIHNHRGGHVSS